MSSKISLFTDKNSVVSNQTLNESFGPISNTGNLDSYRTNNVFQLSPEAPVYAVVKGMIIVIEDAIDNNLVNIALRPFDNNPLGLPLSLIIYTGILKSSLVNNSGDLQVADSSWSDSNILTLIQDRQVKINELRGTTDNANSDSLGLQFSNEPSNNFIESIFYNETDEFHPMIVPEGCQIGKFSGDDAGIQLILDKIGNEPRMSLLKNRLELLEFDPINIDSNLSESEQLKLSIQKRAERERILDYVDITAFYGIARNQNKIVLGETYDDTFLENFANKKVLYIDIRENRGKSYNHFFDTKDIIRVGYGDKASDTVLAPINYYTGDWPILILSAVTYPSNKTGSIFLELPVISGYPENLNVIKSYTTEIDSVSNQGSSSKAVTTNLKNYRGTIKLQHTETIFVPAWNYQDNFLGANFVFLKKNTYGNSVETDSMDNVWDSYFPLSMTNVFGRNNILEGEYLAKIYASYNTQPIPSSDGETLIEFTSGIAFDKHCVTFFCLPQQSLFALIDKARLNNIKFSGTGKYSFSLQGNEISVNPDETSMSFLDLITKHSFLDTLELKIVNFTDNGISYSALEFITNDFSEEIGRIADNFHAITMTFEEYDTLIASISTIPTDPNIVSGESIYLKGITEIIKRYPTFGYAQQRLGFSTTQILEGDNAIVSARILSIDQDISLDNEPIKAEGIIQQFLTY